MKKTVIGFVALAGFLGLASVTVAREVIVSAAPADDKGAGIMDFQICSDADQQYLKDQIEPKLRLTKGAIVLPPVTANRGYIHFKFQNGAPGSLVEASLPYEVVHRPRPDQCGGRLADRADSGASVGPKTTVLDLSQSGKNSEGRMDFPLCCCDVDPRDVRDRVESRIALTQDVKVVPLVVVDDDRMVRVKFKGAKPNSQVELKASSDFVDLACVAAIPVVAEGVPLGYYAAGAAVVGGSIAAGLVISGGGDGGGNGSSGTALSPVQ